MENSDLYSLRDSFNNSYTPQRMRATYSASSGSGQYSSERLSSDIGVL